MVADPTNVIRRFARTSGALVLVLAGARWVYESNPWSGPVLVRVTLDHGVHLNDWLTPVLWYAAILLVRPHWARLVIPLPIRLRMRDEQGAVVGVRLRLVPPLPVTTGAGAEEAEEGSATTVAA